MLPAGTKFGPYEIVAPIGAGGMGEVYRARDSRLDRDVAIKVLPPAFAKDPDRIARFEREAKAVAALSHPNILAIFDTGSMSATEAAPGAHFVVTELLEGETLAERVKAGPLPVRKAIDVGSQIARGLAAAHEKGIVHRDLKPDNVFLTANGHVKILDFGLARAASTTSGSGASETRAAITDAGSVLGTVGYMAPEQVRGQQVDARADLFALGAVLFEMLTGQRAFLKSTAAETMTAILNDDPPDLVSARASLSPALDRIVRHCLEKQPSDRFQTARDVAFALEALSGSDARSASGIVAVERGRFAWITRERAAWALISLTLAGIAAWLTWIRPPQSAESMPPVRAHLLLPPGVSMMQGVAGRRLAVSPDGRYLAFVGMSAKQGETMYLQALNQLAARRIDGGDDAFGPFWSPDSRYFAFRGKDRLLKVDVNGGNPVVVGLRGGAGTWGADDAIVSVEAGSGYARSSRLQLRSASGQLSDAVAAVPDAGEGFAFPWFLQDGRTLLFGYARTQDLSSAGVYAIRLGAEQKTLVVHTPAGDSANFAVASGYLLFVRDRLIMAQLFDSGRLQPYGEISEVAGPVDAQTFGGAAFSVSQNGILVYQEGRPAGVATRMQWFDRSGTPLGVLGDDADYSNLEMSPDGSKVAISITDPAVRTRDIWVMDVVRGVRSRVTFDPSDERSAAWSADGKRLIYTSKGLDLYTKTLGASAEQPFIVDGVSKDPRGVSGESVFVYRATGRGTGNDIWVKFGDAKPKAMINTPFDENYGTISPDGKWMAYVSDETGQYEVYVTSFPSGEGKSQVSNGGGSLPRWRRDGRELFYLSSDLNMMATKVGVLNGLLQLGTAEKLFQTAAVTTPGSSYDVTADGRKFLVNSVIATGTQPSLVIVYNWPALVKKKP